MRGLIADDFRVLEDGVPRPIAAFAAVDLAAQAAKPAASFPKVPLDVQSNNLNDQRLVVLYLDAFALDLVGLRTAKQLGHAIVDWLGPSDLTAVVLAGLDDQAQDLTTDRGRLHAAVDWLTWSSSRLVIGLRLVIDQLARAADRRKVVFLVSRGVPFDPDLLAPMLVRFGDAPGKNAEPFAALEPPRQTTIEPGVEIAVDSMHEILVAKLTALLGRRELRDLVDVQALLEAGLDLDAALRDAPIKDGGFSPLTLAWVLESFDPRPLALALGWDAQHAAALDRFRCDLIDRLVRSSRPSSQP